MKIIAKYNDNETDISFPCSEAHLSKKIKELTGSADYPANMFVKVFEEPSQFNALKDMFLNLDELNDLAKRMDSFNGQEEDTFFAAIFTWTDDAIVTVEKDGEVIPYESGDKLTADGNYTITFENTDGYKKVYEFIIDTEQPEVVMEGAKSNEPVNTDVSVNFTEEDLTAVIISNGEEKPYTSGTAVSDEGTYTVRVTDKAGNVTETIFTIDKSVAYQININDGGLANSVTVTPAEDVEIVLTKDDEVIEYEAGTAITTPAVYTVKLTDDLGNTSEMSFTIIESIVNKFEREIDLVPVFEKALVDGKEVTLDRGTLTLTDSGTYEVSIVANGITQSFTVTVDATAPTLTVNGVDEEGRAKKSVTLTDVSEEADVKVFLNDTEIEYTIGDELTEEGTYKVVVTDDCGNSTEYSFEIKHGLNGGIIALIVIVSLLAVGGVVIFILKKKEII